LREKESAFENLRGVSRCNVRVGHFVASVGQVFADRLRSTSANGQTITYAYDGEGKRSQQAISDGATLNYLWDKNHPLAQLALERNASNGANVRAYRHGLDLISINTGGTGSGLAMTHELQELRAGLRFRAHDASGRRGHRQRVYAGSTSLSFVAFGRQRSCADSLEPSGFARPGATCGGA
jgi:YD repeat-containing protein